MDLCTENYSDDIVACVNVKFFFLKDFFSSSNRLAIKNVGDVNHSNSIKKLKYPSFHDFYIYGFKH